MRPRHAFAALLATCLVAVAIPAAAGSSDTAATPPDLGTVTSQLTPDASTSTSPSPDPSASASASASPSASASSTDPATCIQGAGTNPLAILTCITPTGGTNPLTGLIAQLTSLASSGGAGGLPVAPFQTLATCVQSNLTAVPPDGTKLEACFSAFALAVSGAPQSTCLDPLLQGAIGAVQDLVEKQDPAPLQAVLTGLPATLTTLAACLMPAATTSATPTTSTGTTTQSGGATTPSDPTVAVPVAATPNFTG
ncbi:MAG TPA: hypothetical protein VHZ96_11950 [Frankiaceae bacterium]|nr:hypothetical protein [Frankiaceae bacterium]